MEVENCLIKYVINYMKWLEKYTKKNSLILDDTWVFQPRKIKKENREKINKLYLLFNLICEYASENNIIFKGNELDTYYTIGYNNHYYNIGKIEGRVGEVYVCQRIKDTEEYIDFNNIIEKNNNEIKNNLIILEELIRNLYYMGVSRKDIYNIYKDVTNEIRIENGKKLIK